MRSWKRLSSLCVVAAFVFQAVPASAERRVALVIGNSTYQHTSPLPNPSNDAKDIAAALQRLDFQVIVGLDLTKREMESVVQEFTARLVGVDVALFFYAGHSLQVVKQNFLMPIDARLAREAAVDFETIPLTLVLRHMQAEAKTNLVFLDACRDNPLARTISRTAATRSSYFSRGLAQVEAGGISTLISFSTQPDNVAIDGQGRNSPYTTALLKHIEASGIDIGTVMMRVRNEVFEATQRQQIPWEHSSLMQPFQFKHSVAAQPTPPPPQSSPPSDQAMAWSTLKDSNSVAMLEAFLKTFSKGIYADLARARLQELEQIRRAKENEQRAKEASNAHREAEESRARDREAGEKDRKDKEARETIAREAEAKEASQREVREKEAKEKEVGLRIARDAEAREREAKQKAAKETEAREALAREALAREATAREKAARNKEANDKEVRERVARETKASEKATREVALAQPPIPSNKGAPGQSGVISRIEAWIERDYLADNVAYSPMVDWYSQGMVSRETILKEQAQYSARWPERQYTLIPGTLQITAVSDNRYSASFELNYVVRNAARKAQGSGKSRVTIDVELIDDLLRVTRQRETTGR